VFVAAVPARAMTVRYAEGAHLGERPSRDFDVRETGYAPAATAKIRSSDSPARFSWWADAGASVVPVDLVGAHRDEPDLRLGRFRSLVVQRVQRLSPRAGSSRDDSYVRTFVSSCHIPSPPFVTVMTNGDEQM